MSLRDRLKKSLRSYSSDVGGLFTKGSVSDYIPNQISIKNAKRLGGDAIRGLSYTGDTTQGALLQPFFKFSRDPNTGRINSNFDLKQGLRIYGKELATAGLSSELNKKWKKDQETFGIRPGKNPLKSIQLANAMGRAYSSEESIPSGIRLASSIALDPTSYIGVGTVGRAGRAVQGSRVGRPFAKYLLGHLDEEGKMLPAQSRTARIAGSFIEGFGKPKNVLGAAAIGGLANQLASYSNNPYVQFFGTLGGVAAGAGGATFIGRPSLRSSLTTEIPQGTTLLHGTRAEFEGLPSPEYTSPHNILGAKGSYYDTSPYAPNHFSSAPDWVDDDYIKALDDNMAEHLHSGARIIPAKPIEDLKLLSAKGGLTGDEAERIAKAIPDEDGRNFFLEQYAIHKKDGFPMDGLGAIDRLKTIHGATGQGGDPQEFISNVLSRAGFDGIDGREYGRDIGDSLWGIQLFNNDKLANPWEYTKDKQDNFVQNVLNRIKGTKTAAIGDEASGNFEEDLAFWRRKTMSSDPQEAQQAEDMVNRMLQQRSEQMASESKRIPRGARLDELSTEELAQQRSLFAPDSEGWNRQNKAIDERYGVPDINEDYEAWNQWFKDHPDLAERYSEDHSRLADMSFAAEMKWVAENIRRMNGNIKLVPLSVNEKTGLIETIVLVDGKPSIPVFVSPEDLVKHTNVQSTDPDSLLNVISHYQRNYVRGSFHGLDITSPKNESVEWLANVIDNYALRNFGNSDEYIYSIKNYIRDVNARREAEGGRGVFGEYNNLASSLKSGISQGDMYSAAVGGLVGATEGDSPQERLRNALMGAGYGLYGRKLTDFTNSRLGVKQVDLGELPDDIWAKRAKAAKETISQAIPEEPQKVIEPPLGGTPAGSPNMATTQAEREAYSQAAQAARPNIDQLPPVLQEKFLAQQSPITYSEDLSGATPQSGGPTLSLNDRIKKVVPQSQQEIRPGFEGRNVRDTLDDIIWGQKDVMDESPKKLKANESLRTKVKGQRSIFERPQAYPLGSYRERAIELRNSLPDEILDSPVPIGSEFDIFESLRGAQDIEDVMRIKNAAIAQYDEALSQMPQPPEKITYEQAIEEARPKTHVDEPLDPAQEAIATSQVETALDGGITAPPARDYTVLDGDEPEEGLTYIGDVKPITEVADKVKTFDHWLPRLLIGKTGINPSTLENSPIGRLVVAYGRQQLAAKELVNTALSGVLSRYAGFGGFRAPIGAWGATLSVDADGIIKGLDAHWADVFERPDLYADRLTPRQLDFIRDYHTMIDDVNELRLRHGLPVLPRDNNGALWVPREVKTIDGVSLRRPANHEAERLWERATDAVSHGVSYRNPMETMRLYLTGTYEDIIDKQFADAIRDHTLSVDETVSPVITQKLAENLEAMNLAHEEWNNARIAYKADTKNKDLKTIRDEAYAKYKDAKKEYRKSEYMFKQDKKRYQENPRAVVNGSVFGRHDDPIPVGVWSNGFTNGQRVMELEDWDRVVRNLGYNGLKPRLEEQHFMSELFNAVGNVVRVTAASTDFAWPFTHGLLLAARNPYRWARASVDHYLAFFNPNHVSKMIEDNLDTVNEMAAHGVPILSNEFWAAAQREGEIPRAWRAVTSALENAGVPNPIRNLLDHGIPYTMKQTYGRFEAALEAGLLSTRIQLWKANRNRYLNNKGILGNLRGAAPQNNLHELAQYIRNMSGGMETKALGVGRAQRGWESTWLGFSPKLFRSTIGLMFDATRPWKQEGREALFTLASFATMAGLIYTATGVQQGKSKEEIIKGLNPTSGKKFLSHQVGNNWVGVGGQVRAIMQLIASSEEAIRTGNSEALVSRDPYENPVVSWYLGRGAPGVTLASDIIEGTFGVNANPYEEINGPIDIASSIGETSLPFTVQNYLEGMDAEGIAMSAQGLRVSPLNETERRDKAVSEMNFTDMNGKKIENYNSLNNEQKKSFKAEYPLTNDVSNDNVTRYFSDIEEINKRYENDVINYSQLVNQGKWSKGEFREWMKARNDQKFDELDQLKRTYNGLPAQRLGFNGSVTEYLGSRKVSPEDKAVNDWYSIFEKSIVDGKVDYDMLEKNRTSFLESLPFETRNYVVRNTTGKTKPAITELEQSLSRAKEVVKPFFELDDKVFDIFARESTFFKGFKTYDQYKNFVSGMAQELGITEDMAYSFLSSKIKDVKVFEKARSEIKRLYRLNDPELDRALVDWYDYEPANRIGYLLYNRYGTEAGYSLSGLIAKDKSFNSSNKVTSLSLGLSNQSNLSNLSLANYRR